MDEMMMIQKLRNNKTLVDIVMKPENQPGLAKVNEEPNKNQVESDDPLKKDEMNQ
jgi:hypothetical protein